MPTAEEFARSLQGVNEEEARILRERSRLRVAARRDEDIAHESYCTLCGVPFWLFWPLSIYICDGDNVSFAWVSYFLALRILKGETTGSDTKVDITGVGQWESQALRLSPPGYDIRDILRGRKPMGGIRALMTEDEKKQFDSFDKVFKYGAGEKHLFRSLYLMHPRCWDVLLQQYALVASPTEADLDLSRLAEVFLQIPLGRARGGFTQDWATDYGGPELFWWMSGEWGLRVIDDAPHRQFLLRDPGIAYGFHELFINPPFESTADISGRIKFTDDGDDFFARLPEEILTEILVLLPSASVRDLQLASRRMASIQLSSRYWRSRFEFPNELCHITLLPALKKSGQVGGQRVDWRRLCDQLLHPAGKKPGWSLNRKRITALIKQLLKSMSLRDNDGRLKKGEGVPVL